MRGIVELECKVNTQFFESANWNAVVYIGIETGEHGVEECNQWIKNEHGLQFWDCEWKCSTSHDATDNEFGSAGGGGGGDESRGREWHLSSSSMLLLGATMQ